MSITIKLLNLTLTLLFIEDIYGTYYSKDSELTYSNIYIDKYTCLLSDYLNNQLFRRNMEAECNNKEFSDVKTETIEEVVLDLKSWNLSMGDLTIFPLDSIKENYIRRNVINAIFSAVNPTPLDGQTKVAIVSSEVLEMLDLHEDILTNEEFKGFVSGDWIHPGSTPLAHRYGGHQFGWWAGQLGDGRAHLLGVYNNRKHQRFELQLKGSGNTPYSRSGDGRAVIRSSVREFLAAEAMAALGFRTSRCLSLVTGDEVVRRDMFYNGNLKLEKAAIVLRVADTWFRFGSLEILNQRNEIDNLRLLIDHIITKHYSDIDMNDDNRYLQMYSRIVEETALMIAQWQSIGFTHGVMNTDNMSIISIAIDYGPFGFLDVYNPNFIPNSSDDEGLYSYKNQPKIGLSNLQKLGQALIPLLKPDQIKTSSDVLQGYDDIFTKFYCEIFSKKLGFHSNKDGDLVIINLLLKIIEAEKADFSNTFWELGNLSMANIESKNIPKEFWSLPLLLKNSEFLEFYEIYKNRLSDEGTNDEDRMKLMNKSNPRYILRNWIAQKAITKAEYNDFSELVFVHEILKQPFTINELAETKGYGNEPPKWSKSIKVSCSS